MPIAGRQLIQTAVASLGQILASRPETASTAALKQVEFVVATNQPTEQIVAKCQIPTISGDVSVVLIPRVSEPSTQKTLRKAPSQAQEREPQTGESASPTENVAEENQHPAFDVAVPQTQLENILRVEAGRIDSVLNLVGELIIGKSMLQQALSELSRRYPKEQLRGRFADAIAFQARVLNDLQRSVMKIRMVPVEQLFRRFPRMARDVARQCGRDVELVVSGQDTDLDKGILDAIADRLTHMEGNHVR